MEHFTYKEYAVELKNAPNQAIRQNILHKIALDTGITPAEGAKLKKLADKLEGKA